MQMNNASGVEVFKASPSKSDTNTVRLFLAEEQQILREAYQNFFAASPGIQVIGVSGDTAPEALITAAAQGPDVLLLGIKALHAQAVERLEAVQELYPQVAIVLLSANYDVNGIKALRKFSRGAKAGCAYLLKHTIDTVEQLTQVVTSVAQGRIILDPIVMEGLMAPADTTNSLLKDLSPRELEVLSWMAKGYRNTTIAEVLFLQPKTVERHVNSIYGKLGATPETKHPRVHATTQYLRAMGLLPAEDFEEA